MKPISCIDAEQGKLYFREHDATDLARNYSFEEVLFLLLHGHLPDKPQSTIFQKKILDLRAIAQPELLNIVKKIGTTYTDSPRRITDGFDRTDMFGLRVLAQNLDTLSKKYVLDRYESVLLFVTMAPLVLASGWRHIQGKELIAPRESLNHVKNFYWMLCGGNLPPEELRDLETCIILHMDDPDNPSLAALEKSIKAGNPLSESLVLTLDSHIDPLHHGAGECSLRTMIDIGHSKEVESYLAKRLKNGKLIYGLGHRIYKTIDPRAVVLKEILERRTADHASYALTYRIEEVARIGSELILKSKGKVVYPNVDLYNAAVYLTFGMPYFINTELFAVARSAGWAAHILELNNQ
ncbi:MAG: citrate/2-methylcitrate synthase [Promethearchaeota archaeon]